jgi:hypothetical protein
MGVPSAALFQPAANGKAGWYAGIWVAAMFICLVGCGGAACRSHLSTDHPRQGV